jgi:hypothetical protein
MQDVMKPIMDIDNAPWKMVGNLPKRSPGEFLDRMANQFQAMGVSLPYRKGVYRFKTFEEADAWAMKQRVAAAVKRLRDHQH